MGRFAARAAYALAATIGLAIVLGAGDVSAGVAEATFARVPNAPAGAPHVRRTSPTLVVFGDSLAWGYQASPGKGWVDLLRDRLRSRAPGAAVINASVCGARVVDLRAQVARAPREPARAVLVVAGGNDLMSATDPFSLARADIALVRDIARRYPGARLVVANVPDLSWRSFHLRAREPAEPLPAPLRVGLGWLTAIDNAIVDRIARRSGADVLDLHHLTLDGDASTPGLRTMSLREFAQRYVSSDGLHPNDRGYALLADFAWPHIAHAMNVPGAQDERTSSTDNAR